MDSKYIGVSLLRSQGENGMWETEVLYITEGSRHQYETGVKELPRGVSLIGHTFFDEPVSEKDASIAALDILVENCKIPSESGDGIDVVPDPTVERLKESLGL